MVTQSSGLRTAFGLSRRRGARQFVKFCIVGGVNTVVDFSVYYALTRGSAFFGHHYVLASVVSFTAAVTGSFFLNNFWTFRAGGHGWRSRVPKFFAVATVGVTINALIIRGLVEAGVFDMFAKVAAVGAVLLWNFTAQKKWTFSERD